MRSELERIDEERKIFRGTFVRYGQKSGWKGQIEKTLLFQNVVDVETSQVVTDHLWFNATKGFEEISPLAEGDIVQFAARVRPYEKGYVNHQKGIDDRTLDYKLSHPTKIKKLAGVEDHA